MKLNKVNMTKGIIWFYALMILLGYFLVDNNLLSKLVTIGCAFIGMLYLLGFNRITKDTVIELIIALIPLVYSHSSEGIRYTLLIISLITWSKLENYNLLLLIKFLVLLGGITSFRQVMDNLIRINGFTPGSPPQFACFLFACLVFLLIYHFNFKTKKLYIYELGCLLMIFLTGTRSILAAAVMVFGYFLLATRIQNGKIRKKRFTTILVLIFIFIVAIMFSNYIVDFLNSKLGRDAQSIVNSNNTRVDLLLLIMNDLIKNPIHILVGHGSGYVEEFIKSVYHINEYLPVHQDFVLLLSEFGIIGYVALYKAVLKKHKFKIIFLLLFLFCSFHNVILNTKAMLLFMMIMCYVENNNLRVIPQNIKNREGL